LKKEEIQKYQWTISLKNKSLSRRKKEFLSNEVGEYFLPRNEKLFLNMEYSVYFTLIILA